MNLDNLPNGQGLPPRPQIGSMNKHLIIDVMIGLIGIGMALPGLFYFLKDREQEKRDAVVLAELRGQNVDWSNKVLYVQGAYRQLARSAQENQRHHLATVSGIQQFLTNENIAELEIQPLRTSIFKTNLTYGNNWSWSVSGSNNVIARKGLVGPTVKTQ